MRSFIVVALTLAAVPLTAGTISLNSGTDTTGTSQWNNVGGVGVANTIITPHPVWQPPTGGAQWISFEDTGMGGVLLPNSGTFGALGTTPPASFFQTFNLPAGPSSGGISVWSDDTSAVYIDSILAFAAQTSAEDVHCVTGPISCGASEGGFVSLSGLSAGSHTIRFDLWQLGGGRFGLLYTGQVSSPDPPSVPEPATGVLLTGGLAGLFFYRRFRS